MSKEADKEQDTFRLKLNELFLARKVTVELLRECSMHTSARIENAFMLEIVTLIYRAGLSIEDEIKRQKDSGNVEIACRLEAFGISRVSVMLRQNVIMTEDYSRPVGAKVDL